MVIKVIMPTALPDRVPTIRKYIRGKFPIKKQIPPIEVCSLYRKMHPSTLERQNMVYIANQAPKFIEPGDTIYLLIVDNAILMALLSSRITERMNKLFTRSKRRWYLIKYNSQTKSFDEFFLP